MKSLVRPEISVLPSKVSQLTHRTLQRHLLDNPYTPLLTFAPRACISLIRVRVLPPGYKATTLEADKQALQRRCGDAEDLAERRRRQSEEARERLQEAFDELSRLKQACAGKDRIALDARAEAKHAAERLAAEWGREKAELKTTNEALAKRIVSDGRVNYTQLLCR